MEKYFLRTVNYIKFAILVFTLSRVSLLLLFISVYSNSSYFISGFGAGNIYLSCRVSHACTVPLIILKHFFTCTYIYRIFNFILLCTV